MLNVATATTAELVAFYNAHSGKPAIKKFENRAKAEARCAALLATPKPAPAKKAPKSALSALAETVTRPTKKDEPAPAARGEAATRLYRIVNLSLVKRGAIFDVCNALAGKEFTREEFEAACPGGVRARAHFYWAKAHGVLAA